ALAASALVISSLSAGCSAVKDAQSGLCCSDFVVGADMSGADFKMSGAANGEFHALAQASGDLSAVASASLTDVASACESIARDVGADTKKIADAEGTTGDQARATAWCDLAAATIKAKFSAKGDFGVSAKAVFVAPTCQASVSAQANCEASCTVDGKCDASAMVTCEGGKLPTVQCTGSCEGTADAPSISCTGSCSGKCTGSCSATADVAVACDGKCDGDCTVDGKAGSASGVQADGSCKGQCKGTCTAKGGAAVKCEGSCSGSCDAKCTAVPGSVKFECNGQCTKTDGSLPKCEGSAKLDCKVSADCEGSCSASVNAKAECTPPKVSLELSGTANVDVQAQIDAAISSIELNLPRLLVVLEARGKSFTAGISATADASAALIAKPGDLSVTAVACLVPIGDAVSKGVENFGVAISGSLSVAGAVGVPDPTKT
ncbi:MAG: hypothetical protein ABJB12_04825, partial [Pseudomonadota bacterium]